MTSPTDSTTEDRRSLRRGVVMGVLGLIVLGIGLYALVRMVGGGVKIYAKYTNVDGLHSGSEVRLSGVKVGRVESIRFLDVVAVPNSETPLVEVELRVAETVEGQDITQLIYKDAIAYLRSDGSLADRVIDIFPGHPRNGHIQQGDRIAGQIEANMQNLALRGATMSRNLDSAREKFTQVGERIKQGQGTLGAIQHRKELKDNLKQLSQEIAAFENAINRGPGNIGRFQSPEFKHRVKRLQEILVKIGNNFEEGQGTLGKFSKDQNVHERTSRINETLQRLGETLDRMQKRYDEGQGSLGKLAKDKVLKENLRQLRQNLKHISDGLDRGEGTAGKFLHDPRLNNTVGELSSELLKTLYDMRQTPSRYIRVRFSLF